MANERSKPAHLKVESLESRDLPSGNLAWPIAGINPVLSTYGQFIEGHGFPTLHEGLDIIAPTTTPISAIEDGVIHGISPATGTPGLVFSLSS